MGPEKLVLPEKTLLIKEVLPSIPHIQEICTLWTNFYDLYQTLQQTTICSDEIICYQTKV